MTAHDDHRFWDDELAAYALGALEPGPAAAFEGHLVDCASCRDELALLAPAVDRLPATVAQVQPPPELRRRIMDVVEADVAARTGARSGVAAGWWAKRAPLVAVAVAASLAIALVTGYAIRGDDAGGTTVPARALTSTPVSAALVEQDGTWQLHVDRLPALPANTVYEVWVKRGETVRPSSLFVLSRDGTAQVALPDPLGDGDEVMVTREPAGGSAVPTSDPLLLAQI